MNNIKIRIVAVIGAVMLLTGCGVETAKTTENIPVETQIDIQEETVVVDSKPYHESDLKDFKFGQEVWTAEYVDDAGFTTLVRYSVVGQQGGAVEVVPYFTHDLDQLREVLDGNPDIYLIDICQVHLDKYDAMDVVAEANGESFEDYWGESPVH